LGAAVTGSRDLEKGANAMSVFTGFSGPATLVVTNGDFEAASIASSFESLFTFGYSGAVSTEGVKVKDMVEPALTTVELTLPSDKCPD
jgi:hypothetical protein